MSHPDRERSATRPATRQRRAGWLAAAAGALVAAAAGAQVPMQTIEECLESGTDLVTLPGAPGGTLSARECSGCPSLRLSFGQRTRYFIGAEAVTYARLLEAAGKRDARLDVFYEPKSRTLTRLRLAAAAAK
jgi:hypothetical protein